MERKRGYLHEKKVNGTYNGGGNGVYNCMFRRRNCKSDGSGKDRGGEDGSSENRGCINRRTDYRSRDYRTGYNQVC